MIAYSGPADESADRLVSTLFVATLFHGLVILGVSFSFLAPPAPTPSNTLEVVMVQGAVAELDPEDPEYLAQQNQLGAGSSDARERPATAPSNNPSLQNDGRLDGDALDTQQTGQQARPVERLVTRSESDSSVESVPWAVSDPSRRLSTARLMLASEDSAAALDEVRRALKAQGKNPDEDIITVNARASQFAAYLTYWRSHIEEVGTLNFPDDVRRAGLSGSPVLEVAINADGSIREIRVVRSSSEKLLDQAALRILRIAAPFNPFPEEIRKDYDVLRFVYEWQFLSGEIPTTRGRVTLPADGP